MTTSFSHTTVTVTMAPDTHAYLMGGGLIIASAAGTVGFYPPAALPAVDLAAIASQIIATAEDWRDAALERDAQVTSSLLEQTRRSS